MGRVNRKNNHHVSLKARLGFGFYDHRGGGSQKNNAENRITLFNYFLFYVYLIHKNKQWVMSSPTNEVLPLLEIQQKPVRGKHPRDPRMLQGCVIPPLSAPRPADRPPARPRPQPQPQPQRGGCSPRDGSGHPHGLQPTPGRAPTQAARLAHRQPLRPSRRPSRPGSVYKPLLAVPLSNASPRQTGSRTRTHRVPGREDRPLLLEEQAAGRGLTSLLHCFLRSLCHPLDSLPVPPKVKELSLKTYQRTGSAISSCHS